MSRSRLEWKVGLFVLIGLTLLAILLLQFSKGASKFKSTYDIILKSENVAGLKNRADVLMSGVKIGSVSDIVLEPDGKSVNILLKIYSKYKIHKDARFTIEQAGFLGDQYIAITPAENKGPIFQDGDHASSEPPFNIQEMARSATSLVKRVEDTANTVNQMLGEMRQFLLNPHTMTNLSITVSNMRAVTDRALVAVENVQGLIATNGPSLSQSSSNLATFTSSLNETADSLSGLLQTNQTRIASAVSNLDTASASLRDLMAEVEQGKGLAGNLIKNEELSESVTDIARNLSITSSNLNRLGLWGILWSRKPAKPQGPPPDKIYAPKDTKPAKQ